jgi:hypothetical protein
MSLEKNNQRDKTASGNKTSLDKMSFCNIYKTNMFYVILLLFKLKNLDSIMKVMVNDLFGVNDSSHLD